MSRTQQILNICRVKETKVCVIKKTRRNRNSAIYIKKEESFQERVVNSVEHLKVNKDEDLGWGGKWTGV